MIGRSPLGPALIAAFALAGCVPASAPDGAKGAAGGVAVGPGPSVADGISASGIFGQVCGTTAPGFGAAPAQLTKMPFRQHPTTGTYYHQNLDLSVKLMPKRCSMVFSSRDPAMELGIIMAAGIGGTSNDLGIDPATGATYRRGPKGTSFEFEPLGTANGRPMYRAVLIAP